MKSTDIPESQNKIIYLLFVMQIDQAQVVADNKFKRIKVIRLFQASDGLMLNKSKNNYSIELLFGEEA